MEIQVNDDIPFNSIWEFWDQFILMEIFFDRLQNFY